MTWGPALGWIIAGVLGIAFVMSAIERIATALEQLVNNTRDIGVALERIERWQRRAHGPREQVRNQESGEPR